MADLLKSASGVGDLLGGVGGFMSALNPPSVQTINPAIQAELQARGVDIQEFIANLQASGQNFNQLIAQYPIEVQGLLQEAYTQMYGPAEQAGAQFAEDVFAGRDPAYLTNQISAFGTDVGRGRESTDAAVNQMISQMGIDPSSPYAAELRRKAQSDINSQYSQGVAQMRNQSALSNLALANAIVGRGMTTNRISGVQYPEAPPTAQEAAQTQYESDLAGWRGNLESAIGPRRGIGAGLAMANFARQPGNARPTAPNFRVPSPVERIISPWMDRETGEQVGGPVKSPWVKTYWERQGLG